MQGIKAYLLGVIGAAILCSVVTQLTGKESFIGTAVKLITGVFMLIVLASPLADIQIKPLRLVTDVSVEAEQITSAAANSSREGIAEIIKEQTGAYILDKAGACGVALSVEVSVSDGELPEPVSVILSGDVSPYHKKLLTQTIADDLGIPPEAQIWN